jgi:hypothetical protein
MLNNGPGNNSWKDRLEGAAGFTTPVLRNKQAAWNELNGRLQKKDKRRFIWYSVAAASIVLLIVSALLLPTKQQSGNSDTVSKNETAAAKPDGQVMIITKENIIAVTTDLNKEWNTVRNNPEKVFSNEIHTEYSHEKITMPQMVSSKQDTVLVKSTSLPAAAILGSSPDSTVVQILATVTSPVKKILKVVHVNELGDSSETPNQQRVISDYSVIQIGFIGRQAHHTIPIPANNIGVNISTGKNSPSN